MSPEYQVIFLKQEEAIVASYESFEELLNLIDRFIGTPLERCFISKSRYVEKFAGPGTIIISDEKPVLTKGPDLNLLGSFIFDETGHHFLNGTIALIKETVNTEGEVEFIGYQDLDDNNLLICKIHGMGQMMDRMSEQKSKPRKPFN